MKTRLITGGVLLFIGAIIGNRITPNLMSQVDKIVMPLQGNVSCGMNNDIQISPSQITALSPVNQFFHENICNTLNLTQIALQLSMICIGIIAILIIVYGGLTSTKKIKNQSITGID
jgi:hypothetical protein